VKYAWHIRYEIYLRSKRIGPKHLYPYINIFEQSDCVHVERGISHKW